MDPRTGEPHIYNHNVKENEVEDVLAKPIEDRVGTEGSRVVRSKRYAGDAGGRKEAGELSGRLGRRTGPPRAGTLREPVGRGGHRRGRSGVRIDDAHGDGNSCRSSTASARTSRQAARRIAGAEPGQLSTLHPPTFRRPSRLPASRGARRRRRARRFAAFRVLTAPALRARIGIYVMAVSKFSSDYIRDFQYPGRRRACATATIKMRRASTRYTTLNGKR